MAVEKAINAQYVASNQNYGDSSMKKVEGEVESKVEIGAQGTVVMIVEATKLIRFLTSTYSTNTFTQRFLLS